MPEPVDTVIVHSDRGGQFRYRAFRAVLTAAGLRGSMGRDTKVYLVVLPALGLLTMPLSWLLLEQWKWSVVPQVQPMRGSPGRGIVIDCRADSVFNRSGGMSVLAKTVASSCG